MPRSTRHTNSHSLRCTKERGEHAEAEFLARATRRGFIVSRPWGDSAPYDFIIQPRHRLYRIQVKSAWKRYQGRYEISTTRCNNDIVYQPRDIDFIAAYVIPCDAWYIIPVSFLAGRKIILLYPHNKRSRGKQEPFREAWHLLK